MQKFCILNKWLEKGGCKNSARPYFPLNSLLSLQQMDDAEILHLNQVAYKRRMQKFCTTLFSVKFNCRYNKWKAEILHLKQVAWKRWMQKFCTTLFSVKFTTVATTNERCRNSARPYFPLNSLLYLQQMNDAEILHLIQVAWERWMQKFCTTLFSAKFTTLSTTNERCRNSASHPSGLRKVDAKILHDLIFR